MPTVPDLFSSLEFGEEIWVIPPPLLVFEALIINAFRDVFHFMEVMCS